MRFKIRCSGKLHLITHNGKSWGIPDCKGNQEVLHALSEGRSKCKEFLSCLRYMLAEGYDDMRPKLMSINIGNPELIKAAEVWLAKARETRKSRPKVSDYVLSVPERYENILNTALNKLGIGKFDVGLFCSNKWEIHNDSVNIPHPSNKWEVGAVLDPREFPPTITSIKTDPCNNYIELTNRRGQKAMFYRHANYDRVLWKALPHDIRTSHFQIVQWTSGLSFEGRSALGYELATAIKHKDRPTFERIMEELNYGKESFIYKNVEACFQNPV